MRLLSGSDKNVLIFLSVIMIVLFLDTCSSALIGSPYISIHTQDAKPSWRRPFKARVEIYPSDFRVNPPLQEVDPLGWLSTFEQYKTSQSKAAARNQPLLSSPDQFRRVEWYWGGVGNRGLGEREMPATTSRATVSRLAITSVHTLTTSPGHGVTAPQMRLSSTTTAPGDEEPTANDVETSKAATLTKAPSPADTGSNSLPATKKPFVFTLDTGNKIITTPKIYKKCSKGKKLDGNGVCRKVWTCSNGRC